MRLRAVVVTTIALVSAASFGALATGGPAGAAGTAGTAGAAGGAAGAGAHRTGAAVGTVSRSAVEPARPDSGASPVWGAAEQVPGISTLDSGGTAQLNAVSCAAAGACSAGGFYVYRSSMQAFVVNEAGGTWGNAQGLPSVANVLNTGGGAEVDAVSCPFAGECGASGSYKAGTSTYPFAVGESGGVWDGAGQLAGTGTGSSGPSAESCPRPGRCSIAGYMTKGSEVFNGFLDDQSPSGVFPPVRKLSGLLGSLESADGGSGVDAISCPSVGNCSAGGNYGNGDRIEAFLVDEKNGTWHGAKEVAGKLNVKAFALVNDVSCHSTGNCAAVGFYSPGDNEERPFVVTSKNGVWGAAQTVPGIAALDTGDYSYLTAVSCGAAGGAGNCTAGGVYRVAKNNGNQVFTVTEKNGTWGMARAVSGVAARNTGNDASLATISCVAPGNCSTAGSYEQKNGYVQVWVASQHNGTWGTAGTIAGLGHLNAGEDAGVTGLSCSSVGSCGIVGYYNAAMEDEQPFIADGAIALPTSAALTLSAGTVTYGHEQSEKFSVTTTAANGTRPTGTVTIKTHSGTTLCTIKLTNGAGACRPPASKLKPGRYSILASLAPSQIYMGATSPAKKLTVKK